ncbi:ATP-binding protein [Streptomyces sp. NPDC049954]|uniref:ATP-binding protein n=1 Tax=Streptomyces sp. NPDC049954 TaxID=3155779 RepID=UPI0034218209
MYEYDSSLAKGQDPCASGIGGPAYHEVFSRTEASAEPARRLVRHALGVWGLDVLAEPAALVVSELVANAVAHACGETVRVVVARLDGGAVEVSVSDSSRVRPVPRMAGPDDLGGRGLLLVTAFAACWGAQPQPGGKRVWAQVRG